ncbi:hypothetical protein DPEC_G00184990 [Dallia pectoralis]|uniref:Uncharacterized protein n=1 Tax=Dallia pectoralis TaxID=75939 RepID=A0ACC2GBP6_DALPE|nr:hypothetical protein DPEC_G00184990 [Dallia pectoralis]
MEESLAVKCSQGRLRRYVQWRQLRLVTNSSLSLPVDVWKEAAVARKPDGSRLFKPSFMAVHRPRGEVKEPSQREPVGLVRHTAVWVVPEGEELCGGSEDSQRKTSPGVFPINHSRVP